MDREVDDENGKRSVNRKEKGYAHLEGGSSEEELVSSSSTVVTPSQGSRGAKKTVFGKKKEKRSSPGGPASLRRKERQPKSRGDSDRADGALDDSLSVGGGSLFGVDLSLGVSSTPSHDGVPLPVVVRYCVDYVNQRGLDTEGIYRLSPPLTRMSQLRECAIAGRRPPFADSHEAAALLKMYLRQLPENIFTGALQGRFELAASECPCKSTCTCLTGDRIQALLRRLPTTNYHLCAYVFRHIRRVIEHEQKNKMSLASIGLVLQPTLAINQSLMRIVVMNAAGDDAKPQAATVFFDDTPIKRYLDPMEPDLEKLNDRLRNATADDDWTPSEELERQQSLLGQLHAQVADLRRRDVDVAVLEQHLWDVQTFITQLKRKLKSKKSVPTTAGQQGKKVADDVEAIAVAADDEKEGPCLEMFEEKQLLAVQMELKERIAWERSAIRKLQSQIRAVQDSRAVDDQPAPAAGVHSSSATDGDDDGDNNNDVYWREEYERLKCRREELLNKVMGERQSCARLRAQIEMIANRKLNSKVAPPTSKEPRKRLGGGGSSKS